MDYYVGVVYIFRGGFIGFMVLLIVMFVGVDAFGTERIEIKKLEVAAREIFSLRPTGIIESLDLLRPIYSKTAAYGHFGRTEPEFTWERLDQVSKLKTLL
jgi:S-adenosylmethionine synthetase